jgi:radical SAM protein with 4Fe4S-binding SPASM domain
MKLQEKTSQIRRLIGMSRGRPTLGPSTVSLEITHHCNLRCSFCESHGSCIPKPITAQRSYAGGRRTMDPTTVARLARDLRRIGTGLLELSGKGEPTTHPEFTQILTSIQGAGLPCSLVTNGTHTPPGLPATAVAGGLDRLTLSLNAGSQEVHARVSGQDLWGRAVTFLREILEERRRRGSARPWCRVSCVVCKDNLGDLENLVRLVCEARPDDLLLCVMGELPETRHLQLDAGDVARLQQQADAWAQQLAQAGVTHNLPSFLAEVPLRLSAGPVQSNPLQRIVPCYEAWRFAVIGPDGAVVPCCYCEETVLGNVNEEGFASLWRGATYQDLRRRMLAIPKTGRPICRECFTNCNRSRENLRLHRRIHPFWRPPTARA